MPAELPLVPCADLSGTVDMVGPGVEEFKIGDHVFGITRRMIGEGTLAELTHCGFVDDHRHAPCRHP